MGSDVDKVAEYRAFARMRRAFPQSYTSHEMGNFSRFLIKVSLAIWLSQNIGILDELFSGHSMCLMQSLKGMLPSCQSTMHLLQFPGQSPFSKSLQNMLN